jgi:hypothetical protein
MSQIHWGSFEMPVYRLNGASLLFVHVPKCGGTSLEGMLTAHPAMEQAALYEIGRDNLVLQVSHCSPQHWHGELLQQLLRLETFTLSFTVIRDPLERLLSEFSMQRGKLPETTTDFGSWYQQMQRERQCNPFYADNHLRPAREFLLPKSVVYNYNAGLERIWTDLCSRLAIDAAASPLQHIRPCGGPRLSADAVTHEQRGWIERDYGSDVVLQQQLDQRLVDGMICCLGHELL